MSEILSMVEYRGHKATPRLQIRCARCGRIYTGAMHPDYVRKLSACIACYKSKSKGRR